MSLNATLKAAAATAMNAVGDVKVSCTYTHVPEVTAAQTFDPTNDTVTLTTQEYTFDAVLAGLRKVEMDWLADEADETAQKLIVNYDALPIDEPTPKDSVVINSQTWNVVRVKGVPGKAVHIIFLRRS